MVYPKLLYISILKVFDTITGFIYRSGKLIVSTILGDPSITFVPLKLIISNSYK
jgi:hypothetical protein